MTKKIKLVYDSYENDIGFIVEKVNQENQEYIILKQIDNKEINFNRDLIIYTWGVKKHKEIKCDIIFDATLFSTKIKVDVKNLTGLDEIIQQSIINHNMFDMIMEKIITEIEESNPKIIGIVCNYGKHRSVGWAELIKKFYYKNTIINHIGLK